MFFEEWFEEVLLPLIPKGFTIIMDNARFHRKKRLFLLALAAGVKLLFLPPYSPDLNPIETAWANMKRWIRERMSHLYDAQWCVSEYFWWNEFQYY